MPSQVWNFDNTVHLFLILPSDDGDNLMDDSNNSVIKSSHCIYNKKKEIF